MKSLNIFLLFSLPVQGCLSATDTVSKNESSSQFQFTGQLLTNMGINLNNSLLKLIGKTMSHVENQFNEALSSSYKMTDVVAEICRLHPCSEWSKWSKCDAIRLGEFGGQTRSRTCGLNTTLCKHYATPAVVRDMRVCETLCLTYYTSTDHCFCLKLYDEKIIWEDAEKVCQADGGHLVNVDSDIKVKYVNETILQRTYKGNNLWIDGRRSKQDAPFTYGYKSTDSSFTFWGADDPDNGEKDLCVNYHRNSDTSNLLRWFDTNCDNKRSFICQFQ